MRSPLNDALNRKWSEASATLEKLERELAAEREMADRARREGWEAGMMEAAKIALNERNAEPGNRGVAVGERGFAAQRIIDAILSAIEAKK